MKKIEFLFLTGLMAVVMSCTPKKVVVNNDALMDSILAQCAAAWNSGNPEATANYYTPDAIIFFRDNIYSGRDSILAFCKQVVPSVKNMKTYRGTYSTVNDMITGTGMYTLDWVGPDQKMYPVRGSAITYWKKADDNMWKIIMQVNHQADVVKK